MSQEDVEIVRRAIAAFNETNVLPQDAQNAVNAPRVRAGGGGLGFRAPAGLVGGPGDGGPGDGGSGLSAQRHAEHHLDQRTALRVEVEAPFDRAGEPERLKALVQAMNWYQLVPERFSAARTALEQCPHSP